MMNNGQACIAQTRILASRNRYDEVVDAVSAMVRSMPVGDPADPATGIGPLVAKRQQERVEDYIRIGIGEGAKPVVGGLERPHNRGWYVAPTVFAGATNEMRIAREEIFGPVLSVLTFRTPAEAVEKANNTPYGLSAGVWTDKGSRILWMANQLRAGVVWANTFNRFDPASPFGGYKESGYGREGGRHGLEAYLDV
jgi:betaine-aldehyde dehydrogenase